ncbi:putative diguanylate phosphodiesterase [Magnetospirillum sp. XM-1]|uniref:EAL domain-containing protein n=1 Tax=Magnetospirillum sp. XM-1 TaxID=1663591 RepID=UPI00073DFEBA|nr:EAL domain-containing protein [Magnetospirillum sp. XM-1]CUW40159.1 putative diguanylate phosphodiesterase [Magnetospirillum sp. XM-1]
MRPARSDAKSSDDSIGALPATEGRRIFDLVIRYGAGAVLLWTVLLGLSLWWTIGHQKDTTFELALNTARSAFNKDLAYRRWASGHGGVYVEPSEKTPPSPWMSHLPDRDIIANDGRLLTLMNPAYMLREMMADYGDDYGIKGRIVGIVYLNPNNEADSWEAEAIRQFSAGTITEKLEISALEGKPYLRLIKPFMMEESCQKCHGHLGFPNGSVRGAVGVSVPMEPYLEVESQAIRALAVSHGGFWLVGVLGIGLIGRRSARRLKEKALADEETRLAAHVFRNALEATIITDPRGRILRINPMFTELTGYGEAEVVGGNPRIIRSDHHDADFYKEMWQAIYRDGRWQGEIWNRRKDGRVFVAWESIVAVYDAAGAIRYFIGSFSDITEQVEAQRHILRLAHYDVLTDLPNRVLFQDRLERAVVHALRHDRLAALLFLDLDGFKKVNDTMGHRAGNELLKEVAVRLRGCVRMTDTIARLGGDEFTVILDEISSAGDAAVVAEKILAALRAPIAIDGREVFIGTSIGISLFPADGQSGDELLKQADTAMYQAKAAGKGRFNFYSAEMTKREEHRLELEMALRQAVDEEQFHVHYQPKKNLAAGRVSGFEALVRWQHPSLGMIAPLDFIPLAEEMHLVDRIDLLVMRQACRQGRIWLDQGHDVTMAVNLSGVNFSVDDLPDQVRRVLDETGFPADHLELEITESFVIDLEVDQREVMQRLRALGVMLAIDDFGTGYSSLSYLKRLPVNTLKIDRSFVRDIARDSRDMMLVSSIIGIAHSLGLKVVAEGIEDSEQMSILETQECDEIQGYFIAKPMSAELAGIFMTGAPASHAVISG